MRSAASGSVRRRGSVIAMLCLALIAALGGGGYAAPSGAPIVIGGTLGLTGPFAGPSAEYQAVYTAWEKEINARGGLLGRPVKLLIYNDEGSPTTAQALYERLIDQDKVDLLLSPYTTFVGGAIVPIVLSHHMLLFNGGFVGIQIFQNADGWIIGAYTYQEPDYTRGVFEIVDRLPAAEKPVRVAILTAQNPFPIVVRDGFKGQGGALAFARNRGMQVVLNEQYPPSTPDFTGLIQRAKAANADMLLELGLPDDSLNVVRTVAQVGYRPKMFCTCGSQVGTLPAFAKLGAAREGVLSTTMAWPTDNYTGVARLAELFKDRGDQDIPAYGTVSYTILQVLEQAVSGARTLDQTQLRAYIHSHNFATANGNLRFGSDGYPPFSQLVVQWQGDGNVIVWPSNRSTGKLKLPMR